MTMTKPQPAYRYKVDFHPYGNDPTQFLPMTAGVVSVENFSLFNADDNTIKFIFRLDDKHEVLHNVMDFAKIFRGLNAGVICIDLIDADVDQTVTQIRMSAKVKDVRLTNLDYMLNAAVNLVLECSYTIDQIV